MKKLFLALFLLGTAAGAAAQSPESPEAEGYQFTDINIPVEYFLDVLKREEIANYQIRDMAKALPAEALAALRLERITELAVEWIPLAGLGFGWVLPAFLGLLIGLLIKSRRTAGGNTKDDGRH